LLATNAALKKEDSGQDWIARISVDPIAIDTLARECGWDEQWNRVRCRCCFYEEAAVNNMCRLLQLSPKKAVGFQQMNVGDLQPRVVLGRECLRHVPELDMLGLVYTPGPVCKSQNATGPDSCDRNRQIHS
jgi:hypothetical protein